MKVEHIIWQDDFFGQDKKNIAGVCDISVSYHGGGEDRFIMEGIFHYDEQGKGSFHNFMGRIDDNYQGVSGVYLNRVATFPDRGE